MNDIAAIRATVEAISADEKREKTLVRFESHMRELSVSPPLERVAAIDKELDLIEQYARDTGLFRDPEMLQFRIGRLVTRWHLGERLAKMARGHGPGRGKKDVGLPTSFRGLLERIKVDTHDALDAQRIACLPASELEAFCKRARDEAAGQLPTFAELLRAARPWWEIENRREKHNDIHRRAKQSVEPLGPFPLIYADPPWRFDTYSELGKGFSADRHYPTLSDEEIIAFKVGGKTIAEIADRDAALFLWCTSSNQFRAGEILKGWGFTFKTGAVWDKGKTGLGYVFRNQHEVLLYGTRGDMPGPQWQPPSVFRYPVGEHSAKPPEIRTAVERMYPAFDASTRLELFARGDTPGWTGWGFEA